MRINRKFYLSALALAFVWTSAAEAANFSLSGNWNRTIGNTVNIPLNFQPVAGTGGEATVLGSNPASVMIPGPFINGVGKEFAFGVPVAPSVQQLATTFTFNFPQVAATLKPGAWTATRAVANFAHCPGASQNPACTTPAASSVAGPGAGTKHGIMTYTVGANQFGGLMRMLIGGSGTLSIVANTSPLQVSHGAIAGTNTVTPQPTPIGGPYNNGAAVSFIGGPVTSPVGLTANGLITAGGPVVGTGPGGFQTDAGFPFTTGMITGQATLVAGSQPQTRIATGADSRTPRGAGNLSLVAGGIFHRAGNTARIDIVTANMVFERRIPTVPPIALGAGAALMAATIGLVVRRRRNA